MPGKFVPPPPTRYPAAASGQPKLLPHRIAPPPVKFPVSAQTQAKPAYFAPPARRPPPSGAPPTVALRHAPKFPSAALRRGTVQRMEEVKEKSVVIERPKFQVPKLFDTYVEKVDINNKKLLKRMLLANDAISYTRTKLFVGAGNLDDQIKSSSGWSAMLADRVGQRAGSLYQKIKTRILTEDVIGEVKKFQNAEGSDLYDRINGSATRAIAAKKLGAGVCDDFAAVAFFYLRKKPVSGTEIYRASITQNTGNHAVVILADPGLSAEDLSNSDSAIVVDAWPTNAFAVCMAHWKYKNCALTIKFKGSDLKTENYLRIVRDTFRKPYTFNNEKYYRSIDDLEGSKDLYKSFWKEDKELVDLYSKTAPEKLKVYTFSSRPTWYDKNALDDETENKLVKL